MQTSQKRKEFVAFITAEIEKSFTVED